VIRQAWNTTYVTHSNFRLTAKDSAATAKRTIDVTPARYPGMGSGRTRYSMRPSERITRASAESMAAGGTRRTVGRMASSLVTAEA
jgi:hypothetical protein